MTKGIGYTTVRRKSRCRRRNEIVKFCVRISHERTIKSGILYVGLRNYGKMNLKWHELTASVNEWKTDMYQFTGYCSTVYVCNKFVFLLKNKINHILYLDTGKKSN